MYSVKNILPLIIELEHIEFIKKHFVFTYFKLENINQENIISSIDSELYCSIKQIQDTDYYNTTPDKITITKKLIRNILFINNLDYFDTMHSIRGAEKYLIFQTSTEKIINNINISIVFKNVNSALLNLYIFNNYGVMITEFAIGSVISKYSDFFINYYDYFTCNCTSVITKSKPWCSCVGIDHCENKYFIISDQILDLSLDNLLKYPESTDNIITIFTQIIYMLKHLQNTMSFIHGNLSIHNIYVKKYDVPFTKTFNFGTSTKTINTNFIIKFSNFYNNVIDTTNDIFSKKEKKILDKYIEKTTILTLTNSNDDILNLYDSIINKEILNRQFNFNMNKLLQFENMDSIIENIDILHDITPVSHPYYQDEDDEVAFVGGNNILIRQIENCLNEFNPTEITPILIPELGIDIDGYDETLIKFEYFDKKKVKFDFTYKNLLTSHDFYNTYGDIKSMNCIDEDEKKKKIYFGNPGFTKFFQYEKQIYYNNVYLDQLEHPTKICDSISYTYIFVVNKYNNNVNVRFGKIINLLEIGCKHSIIAYGDDTIVAGELQIVKKQNENKASDFMYYINFNSSKMHPSNVNFPAKFVRPKSFSIFYYIYMINLAYKLFTTMNPELNISITKNTKIKYGMKLDKKTYMWDIIGDTIVDYYRKPKCPTSDFLEKYNQFGEKNKIKNACAGYSSDRNIIQNNGVNICKWNIEDSTYNYYKKYIKYKTKYLKFIKKN